MPVVSEQDFVSRPIQTTREPVGPKTAGSKGSIGDQAVMDAVIIVGAAWLIIFMLWFSLRSHNV